uniref:RAD51 interacting motif domain-containing protein n=1 Tax=Denticeps clupeoides TaxID=299321 RepID=A0AAY4B8L9_9TELE
FADAKTPPVKKARPREPEVKRSSKAEGQEGPPPAPGREERYEPPSRRPGLPAPFCLTRQWWPKPLSTVTGGFPICCAEPESDADSDFTDEESEDEGFTAKKGQKKAARVTARTVKRCRNERKPTKASKARARSAGTSERPPAGSSPVTQPRTVPRTTPTTPPVSSSPAGSRVPKWNPPGQVGRSPSASPGVSVKSPGQGLRLGLSRLARVKPLHPNGAAHHPPHPFPNAVI